MWPFLQSNHWGSHIPPSWMVHAGCIFVANIHPSRTWMSESFESVQWNACVHRLDPSIYSHLKEFLGNGVRTHVNSKGKIPSTRIIPLTWGSNPRSCIKQDSKPNTLPQAIAAPTCISKSQDSWSTAQRRWEEIHTMGGYIHYRQHLMQQKSLCLTDRCLLFMFSTLNWASIPLMVLWELLTLNFQLSNFFFFFLQRSPAISVRFTILGEIFAYVNVFWIQALR